MSTTSIELTPQLHQYLLNMSLRETPVLKQLRQKTSKLPGAVMQISPEQGQFMALLIHLMGARKALDIGTFTGYSSLVIAQALPANGKVITCDIDEQNTNIAKQFWQQAGVVHKIDLRLGQATETLDKLIQQGEVGTFDLAFIDADKNNYDIYYEKAFELLRKGGLILIDNVLWSGQVIDPMCEDKQTDAIRSINQKLKNDLRIELSMLPIGDGLTLALKK